MAVLLPMIARSDDADTIVIENVQCYVGCFLCGKEREIPRKFIESAVDGEAMDLLIFAETDLLRVSSILHTAVFERHLVWASAERCACLTAIILKSPSYGRYILDGN